MRATSITLTQQATGAMDVPTKGALDAAEARAADLGNATGTLAVAKVPTITTAKVSDFSTAVDARISTIVGGAASAYDTLLEIQGWLQADDAADAALVNALDAAKTRITNLENATPPATAPQEFTCPAVASGATWTITHGKGRRVLVQVWLVSTNEMVLADVTGNGATSSTVLVSFGTAGATAGQYVALVI